MHKNVPVKIKATGTEEGLAEGQFRALVSVFGNKDSMGDIVVPGAFTKTLADWAASGDAIPIYWSHQMHDPDFNVGWVLEASETADGLEVLGQLDLDPEASPKARQVYRLLKGRRVTQFSFAYDIVEGGPVEADGDTANELRELKVYELGPTPIGANQETELLGVKADLKRGRVLSAKNETALSEAVTAIQGGVSAIKTVLASVSPSGDDDESKTSEPPVKANGPGPATPKEPLGATGKEPSRRTPSAVDLGAAWLITSLEGATP